MHPRKLTSLICAVLFVATMTQPSSAQTKQESPMSSCARSDDAKNKNSIMFSARDGIAIGYSVNQSEFPEGKRIFLEVWIDNQTDETRSFLTCYLHAAPWDVDVYAEDGRRMLTRREHLRRIEGKSFRTELTECYRTFGFEIPSHTCQRARDVTAIIVDSVNLDAFELPEGLYFVVPTGWLPASAEARTELQEHALRIRIMKGE